MSDTPSAAPSAPATTVPSEAPAASEVNESSDTSQEAAPQEAAAQIDADPNLNKEQKKQLKKQLKIKVDGQEFTEEFDPNDDDYLRKNLQLAKVSQKRMQETAEIKKQVGDFLQLLQRDPAQALADLGIDPDQFAEGHLTKKVEDLKKSPQQLAQEKVEAELTKLKAEIQRKEQEAQQAEIRQLQQQYEIELDRDITDALVGQNELPKSPYVVKRMADLMLLAIKNGNPNVKASDVMPVVRKQIKRELQDMFGQMPEDILENVVGKPNMERMRKKRLATKTPPVDTSKKIVDSGRANKSDATAKDPKVRMSDFFKKL